MWFTDLQSKRELRVQGDTCYVCTETNVMIYWERVLRKHEVQERVLRKPALRRPALRKRVLRVIRVTSTSVTIRHGTRVTISDTSRVLRYTENTCYEILETRVTISV